MALVEADSWPSAEVLGDFVRRNTDWGTPNHDIELLVSLAHCAVSLSIEDAALSGSRLVATAAGVVMGSGDVAFVAYIIVDMKERRQGYARLALLRLLRQLDTVHAVSRAMLVATAVAEPLYRNLGFTDFPHLKVRSYKFVGTGTSGTSPEDAALSPSSDSLERALAIVASAAKGDLDDSRSKLLRTAVADYGAIVAVAEQNNACCFIRMDEKLLRLGPLVACSVASGVEAVNRAVAKLSARSNLMPLTSMALIRTGCSRAHDVLSGAGFEAGEGIPFLHLNCAAGNPSVAPALASTEYLSLTGYEHL